jgi:8-oxo-dGTP diphosphatase
MARSHAGTPVSTPEADPFWCAIGEIPYDRMWADDPLWLPRVLAGEKVLGRFIFDGDRMLSHEVRRLIPVTCAVIERDGEFLVAQRSASMSRPLQWEFPGGKIDGDEPPEECIAREIAEELGLTVRVTGRLSALTYTYSDKAIRLIPFACEIAGGELRNTEHNEIRWVSREEMRTLDWCDADRMVVRQVMERG